MVSISACHAEDPGSIPGGGVCLFLMQLLASSIVRQLVLCVMWMNTNVRLGMHRNLLETWQPTGCKRTNAVFGFVGQLHVNAPATNRMGAPPAVMVPQSETIILFRTSASYSRRAGLLFPSKISWAEARIKITRITLTIKRDRNWSSFQLASNTPPLSVTGSVIAPSARMLFNSAFSCG